MVTRERSCNLSSGFLSSVWHQRQRVRVEQTRGTISAAAGNLFMSVLLEYPGPSWWGNLWRAHSVVDDKSKGTRGIRKGKRLFSAFSNACRTQLRTKLIHSLKALGVADEVAEPDWGWLLPHQAGAEGTDGTTGPEQALMLGQPGVEAQPGDAPSQGTPRGNFVSIKFTHEVFSCLCCPAARGASGIWLLGCL